MEVNDEGNMGGAVPTAAVVRLTRRQMLGKISASHEEDFNAEYCLRARVAPEEADERLAKWPVHNEALRFGIGTQVECLVGGDWVRGVVRTHDYRVDAAMVAPYQIRLCPEDGDPELDGEFVWAPSDCDSNIRPQPTGSADVISKHSIWDKHATGFGIGCLGGCLVAAYFYQQAPMRKRPEDGENGDGIPMIARAGHK